MAATFDAAAVRDRLMRHVRREARRYEYRSPILTGFIGTLTLFVLYMTIVTLAQGRQHAIELFGQDAWLVIPIMTGFGVQVGLYTYLRGMLRRGSRSSEMMIGAGGGTSTAAMVACCAHHVADLLPLLGLSAAASFLAAYKIPSIKWDGPAGGGHHRQGTLSFPQLKNRGQALTLALRGIAAVPERTFTWKVN